MPGKRSSQGGRADDLRFVPIPAVPGRMFAWQPILIMCINFFRALPCIMAALALTAGSLHAQIYTEVGDAGQTLATAQTTGPTSGQSLSTILGTISGISDADLFIFTITSPTTFSASTVNGATALDTALFLFRSGGTAIYTNDDANGATLQSTLPAGTSFTMTLSPGVYYLGISLSGNEPINLNNQLLFAGFPGGDTTAVRGPAAGINPNTHSNFDNLAGFAEMGAYQITLTSAATAAAVPEPSTTALSVVAATILLLVWKRRQMKSIA
jgi:hypothetical protein